MSAWNKKKSSWGNSDGSQVENNMESSTSQQPEAASLLDIMSEQLAGQIVKSEADEEQKRRAATAVVTNYGGAAPSGLANDAVESDSRWMNLFGELMEQWWCDFWVECLRMMDWNFLDYVAQYKKVKIIMFIVID